MQMLVIGRIYVFQNGSYDFWKQHFSFLKKRFQASTSHHVRKLLKSIADKKDAVTFAVLVDELQCSTARNRVLFAAGHSFRRDTMYLSSLCFGGPALLV
jgi:hypothetical protein